MCSPVIANVSDDPALVSGVYDAQSATISLYVNGIGFREADDAVQKFAFGTPWAARGNLAVGNGRLDAATALFAGAVDRIEIFAGAFDAEGMLDYYDKTETLR